MFLKDFKNSLHLNDNCDPDEYRVIAKILTIHPTKVVETATGGHDQRSRELVLKMERMEGDISLLLYNDSVCFGDLVRNVRIQVIIRSIY